MLAGDVLFFHYSGHGVLHEDATGELLDAYCPCDFAEVPRDVSNFHFNNAFAGGKYLVNLVLLCFL